MDKMEAIERIQKVRDSIIEDHGNGQRPSEWFAAYGIDGSGVYEAFENAALASCLDQAVKKTDPIASHQITLVIGFQIGLRYVDMFGLPPEEER